jgi:hypothetical protein
MLGIKSGNLDPAVRHSPAARQARRRSGLRTNSIAIVVMLLTRTGSAWPSTSTLGIVHEISAFGLVRTGS